MQLKPNMKMNIVNIKFSKMKTLSVRNRTGRIRCWCNQPKSALRQVVLLQRVVYSPLDLKGDEPVYRRAKLFSY